jgi:hypothetical protein
MPAPIHWRTLFVKKYAIKARIFPAKCDPWGQAANVFIFFRRMGMTEKDFLSKALNDVVLSRRSFVKWSAALGGTAALVGGVSSGLKVMKAAAATEAPASGFRPRAGITAADAACSRRKWLTVR